MKPTLENEGLAVGVIFLVVCIGVAWLYCRIFKACGDEMNLESDFETLKSRNERL